MALDPEIIKQLFTTFSGELTSKCQSISDGLLQLEQANEDVDATVVLDTILRDAHNIKGAAHGLALVDIGDLAHHLESLFKAIAHGDHAADSTVIDLGLETIDRLPEALEDSIAECPLRFNKEDLVQRLIISSAKMRGAPEETRLQSPEVSGQKIQSEGIEKLESEQDRCAKEAEPVDILEPEVKRVQVAQAVDSTIKEAVDHYESRDTILGQNIHIGREKLDDLGALVEELMVAKLEVEEHSHSMRCLEQHLRRLLVEPKPLGGFESIERQPYGAGEGVDHLVRTLEQKMHRSATHLDLLCGSLQSHVRMMRLVPAGQLLKSMARSVRDIAQELGKQVSFELQGELIEIDRSVLEAIRDPLIHLLRNAIDHGIELPQQRRAANKPEMGQITLAVSNEGSQIIMRVMDDGAGIRLEKVREAALKKRLVSYAELERMGDNAILNLIFRPGFSSKEIVTNFSGRGVGLDVVQSNLRNLKGLVEVNTTPGLGTTFSLHMPLTLASDQGLFVLAGGVNYVLPSSSIDRVLELSRDKIFRVEGRQVIILDGQAVPLQMLADILALPCRQCSQDSPLSIVVVTKGWDKVAFLVEEIQGEREIVIKRLHYPLKTVPNVIGATLTGSGEVVVVLNPADLVEQTLRNDYRSRSSISLSVESSPVPRILVADDSLTTRTLIKSILVTVGYEVTLAVDGQDAWQQLQNTSFDLLVSDVQMPEMDGFALTEKVKQSDVYQHLPVILVTTLAGEQDHQRGIEVGADAYIVKGAFETKALLDVVQQFVATTLSGGIPVEFGAAESHLKGELDND